MTPKDRPRYIVLCNFDEFWIYDFDYQRDEPVHRVLVALLRFFFPLRIGSQEFVPIEVDHVVWGLSDPDFGLP